MLELRTEDFYSAFGLTKIPVIQFPSNLLIPTIPASSAELRFITIRPGGVIRGWNQPYSAVAHSVFWVLHSLYLPLRGRLKSILKSKRLKSRPLAPSIIEILTAYQLYKPYEDFPTIQLKPKKKKKWRGKRAGRSVRECRERRVLYNGDYSIPVICIVRNDSGTKNSRNKQYETCLVTINSLEPKPTLPILKP